MFDKVPETDEEVQAEIARWSENAIFQQAARGLYQEKRRQGMTPLQAYQFTLESLTARYAQ